MALDLVWPAAPEFEFRGEFRGAKTWGGEPPSRCRRPVLLLPAREPHPALAVSYLPKKCRHAFTHGVFRLLRFEAAGPTRCLAALSMRPQPPSARPAPQHFLIPSLGQTSGPRGPWRSEHVATGPSVSRTPFARLATRRTPTPGRSAPCGNRCRRQIPLGAARGLCVCEGRQAHPPCPARGRAGRCTD
ncbi:MAG: hypothetical protein JWP03_738 [Phycisphaerales bacterium]|nr:hypothetical protein [Phycisphaerales bacterium]